MRALRWILPGLYVALVVGLFAAEIWDYGVPVVGLVTVVSLAVFIFGAGTRDLFRPIRRPRLLLPVAVAAFLFGVLAAGLTIALDEAFSGLHSEDDYVIFFWAFLAANWIFWAALLYVYTRDLDRFHAIFRLAQLVFAGSLAELLSSVVAHLVVQRRPGCFVGIQTAIGILAGLAVMFWSFGPGILLLSLRQAAPAEKQAELLPSPRCLARPTKLQFSLRSLLVVMLVTSVVCALLKTFWGHWPAAAVPAALVMALVPFQLTRFPRTMMLLTLAVFAVLIWLSHDEWPQPGILAVLAVMSLVLVYRVFGASATEHQPARMASLDQEQNCGGQEDRAGEAQEE
jgi:hypothetical protein